MSRRALTLMVAGFLTLLLGVVGAVLPVPYVVLSPGPTENTIGDVKGEPVISIEGRETYPTSGKLSLVTVAYQGGPGNRIDLFSALRGWVDPTVAVVPEETIFPPTSTAEEVDQQNIQEMTNSQDDATAAALSELKIPYTAVVSVASVQKGFPADGKFRAGDEIVSIDGVRVIDRETVSSAVRKHKAGQKVTFAVKRAGQSTTLTVPTRAAEDGTPIVGITMQIKYRFPFKVKINVGDVGGPSAGMMFSLGIMDKLTPGPMTGGKAIAGTGTITAEGEVGPIGGIQQKMVGARKAGATVFLTPADNCAEAARATPDGLKLIKVKTLHDAVQAIDVVRTGSGTAPGCSAG
ncbi:PDZ domain-containing protein [Streptosporangium sp. NBC_01639]|uniref:YlbL family protein n=1 Tax=unclassified Streptosporangium TaxID=2632669 RepID=UPI002DD832B9|nr:PDZ domain-containing protein [Streptosporangium sp. NBC_01756]WSC89131.1 PDZ domain-containing protein [Streptosporangium sp. NBC_01756]WTD52196.1 PDZ domain-containing protein [Streptosporangium sp. NBC_01639]